MNQTHVFPWKESPCPLIELPQKKYRGSMHEHAVDEVRAMMNATQCGARNKMTPWIKCQTRTTPNGRLHGLLPN